MSLQRTTTDRTHALAWLVLTVVYFALDQGRNEAFHEPELLVLLAARSAVWGAWGFAASRPMLAAWHRTQDARARLGIALIGVPLGAFVWLVAFAATDGLLGLEPGFEPPWEWPAAQFFSEYGDYLLSMAAWAGALLAADAQRRAHDARVDAAELRALAQQAQLSQLQRQLSPHFLFNSLNSAIALVQEDPDHAEQMLTDLSELLRETLALDASVPHPLRDELALVRRYVAIETIRFEDRLQVDFDIDTDAESVAVPILSVQGLVGNAIKHGTMQRDTLRIRIHAARTPQRTVISVRNDGTLGDAPGARRGLAMLEDQLSRIPGASFALRHDGDEVHAEMVFSEPP